MSPLGQWRGFACRRLETLKQFGSNASEENIWASTRGLDATGWETNSEASLLNTPLAVPLTTSNASNATRTPT
jgi:hypothetical protein